jgi:hypothetical protein
MNLSTQITVWKPRKCETWNLPLRLLDLDVERLAPRGVGSELPQSLSA